MTIARPDDAAAEAPRRSTGGRLKLLTILAIVVGAGIGFASATQTWYTVTLTRAATHGPITVAGSVASPALTALALAALALALALAIAGRIARVAVSVLGVILGACVVIASVGAPAQSSGVRAAVSTATGITGNASVHALIQGIAATAWPTFALIGGILIVLGSIAALVAGGRWPGGSRRYDAATGNSALRFEDADDAPSAPPKKPAERPGDSAVDDWDELTRGDDPTAE